MTQHAYAPAYPHNPIQEIFPDIYWVQGSIRIGFGLSMNRNMVIIRQNNELTLINAVRLNEHGLSQLNHLGVVKHLIRLGDFHGLDEQFYIDTYQAHFWSQKHHVTYPALVPDSVISASTKPPITNAEFFIFETAQYPEAALLIKPAKLLITTDSIQYWSNWHYMSFFSKIILWLMGFRLGLFIGGPWLKRVTPQGMSLQTDFERLLQFDFDALIAAHGSPLTCNAKKQLIKVVKHTFSPNKKVP
ncbi:MAG: hypothetical protein EOO69_10030 [Moraxellaceae bacterium]|nr:MAG: hypothetical protein EOO69_10030 [Moraxellaceae bacterium]